MFLYIANKIGDLFSLIKSFFDFAFSLFSNAIKFIASVPKIVQYLTDSIGILPSVLSTIHVFALGFLMVKAVTKYI